MDMAEQLCYIPCSYCNIILAVSVPCSSLFDVVTVRCGHCANLWTVNMAAAFHPSSSSFPPDLHLQGGLSNYTQSEYRVMEQLGSSSKWNYSRMPMPMPMQMQQLPPTFINKPDHRIINRPPEKRQRVPSAYNQFIKEEIQRIKANNPDISHREAFSTAAKNWAHFPHIHFGLMLESKNQADKLDEGGSDKHQLRRAAAAVLNN